jgi:hypothetical protein
MRRTWFRREHLRGGAFWPIYLELADGFRGAMKIRKSLTTIQSANQAFTIHPKALVFFDRKTGTQCADVKANADGSMPVNQVASLLALHYVGSE